MMVPQPTAQYGQVDRVSLARAIFSVRSCAYAGCRSNPNTAAAAPPTVVNFRKSRREGFIGALSREERRQESVSRRPIHKTSGRNCQVTFSSKEVLPAARCQPADAEVCARGNSVSAAVL